MPLTSLPAPEPGLEAPTAFAELEIDIGYAFPWGFPLGKVRPGRAHDSIITLGILGSVVVGIAGAVITLRRSPDLVAPAFAELALAGTSAVLIATCPAAGRRAAGAGRSLGRQRPPGRQHPLAWRLPAAIRGQRLTWLPDGGAHSACAWRARRSCCMRRPSRETLSAWATRIKNL